VSPSVKILFLSISPIKSESTQDYAYGFEDSKSLPNDEKVLNADTYALYTNGTSPICPPFIQPRSSLAFQLSTTAASCVVIL